MTVLYYKPKTTSGFWYRRSLNSNQISYSTASLLLGQDSNWFLVWSRFDFQMFYSTINGEIIILVLTFWDYNQFGPYILGSQSIWSLHFSNSQFGLCYFQVVVNLVPIVNSLMENIYVANGFHCWRTHG